ncbi:Acetophenone carboxylase gamma subunit [archaeon HR01]|nr:Acetophenone carboxylase gamma subunit [archaeon HR01]
MKNSSTNFLSLANIYQTMSKRVAIDIGGGFTDLFAIDEETGEIAWSKDETTPANYSEGVMRVFSKSGVDPSTVSSLLHGQTLVINTIITRRGSKVGLITTKGFRDVILITRSNRRDIYNLRYRKPASFVPRHLIREVDERVGYDGTVLKPLNEGDVEAATKSLVSLGVQSIAVCYINSYANQSNEARSKELIVRVLENMGVRPYVSVSSEITGEWREYERTSTTVLNAYVHPQMDNYLRNLEEILRRKGVRGELFMMLSSGGVSTFRYAADYPILSIESGPAAGVVGAITIGELLGIKNIIALDGGSTTTKASLVEELMPRVLTDYYVERDQFNAGYPVKVPVIDIVEVGNGGGSIAWIDETGSMRVGPASAGADPGPACYGRGGQKPTLTDAYLITGIINPNYFLGGALRLDIHLAKKAMGELAERLDMTVDETAFGVVRLGNDNASQVIRRISIERGYDPRDFTIVAFGGSGPMFASFIAEELEVGNVIIPSIPPGVFSAWGLLMTDLRHDFVKTSVTRLDHPQAIERVANTYSELEVRARGIQHNGGKKGDIVLARYADMRYYGQEHVLKVGVPNGEVDRQLIEELERRFHENHYKYYSFKLDSPIEIVNYHVVALLKVRKPILKLLPREDTSVSKAFKGEREAYLDAKRGWVRVEVYERGRLPPGATLKGPMIVEDPTSTAIVLPGQKISVDQYGNLHVRKGGE